MNIAKTIGTVALGTILTATATFAAPVKTAKKAKPASNVAVQKSTSNTPAQSKKVKHSKRHARSVARAKTRSSKAKSATPKNS